MTNREYFLGFEENENHSRNWEKDCFCDNYGVYDDENDFDY